MYLFLIEETDHPRDKNKLVTYIIIGFIMSLARNSYLLSQARCCMWQCCLKTESHLKAN